MERLNLILLAVLTVCALGLVTSQHRARELFIALGKEHKQARALEVEYGQLQLEASTWSMHTRVERIASEVLHMRAPDRKHLRIVLRKAPADGAKQ